MAAATPRRTAFPLAVAALLAACAPAASVAPSDGGVEAAPVRHRRDAVPPELAPAAARAEAAVRVLRDRLAVRLEAAIASGGPAAAATLCDEQQAQALAAAVVAQTGVELGRSPARPRDEGGALPRWARPLVEEAPGRRAADVAPVVLDLGDRVALLQPIAAAGSCLSCHGGPERRAAGLGAEGGGRAAGFQQGDVLGYFWAEARK